MEVASPIPHKKARIEIIPLIDIMFFLLASFMMVSLSQVHMKGMKVNLPTGQSGEAQSKEDYISVSVDKDGYTYFDKEKIALEADLPKLLQIHSEIRMRKYLFGAIASPSWQHHSRCSIKYAPRVSQVSFEIKSQALKGFLG